MSAPKANPVNVTPAPSAAPVRPVIAGPNDDELQLVTAARAGDIPAFETLVNRYERKIFRLGMNITGSREDAEDVMQEAFLKAYQHLPEFEGNSRFYTWLVRIAVNQALMKLRKRRPNQVSLDEEIETGEDSFFRDVEDWGPSPAERYEQTQLHDISESFSSFGTSKKCPPKRPRTCCIFRCPR
jgi:RNA polymerase sigma-70 factor (ECF subfamily)